MCLMFLFWLSCSWIFLTFLFSCTFDWFLFRFLVKDRKITLFHSLFNHCLLLFFLFPLFLWLSLYDPSTQSIALAIPLPFLCFDSHILIAHFPISGINEIFIHTRIYWDLGRTERGTWRRKEKMKQYILVFSLRTTDVDSNDYPVAK